MKLLVWLTDILQGVFGIGVMIAGIAAIFLLAIFVILKLNGKPVSAVMVSTIGSSVLMIPVVWAFNIFITSALIPDQIKGPKTADQQVEIQRLTDRITQLENMGVAIANYEKVMRIDLVDVIMKQKDFYRKEILVPEIKT